MKLCDRFKKDSKFAMLLLLILVLILMILFAILAGFTLWFWIMLVVFAAFFYMFRVLFKASFLGTIMIFIVFFVLTITWVVRGAISKNDSSTSSGGLVACTSTASDVPTTIAGYKASMFSQPVSYEGTADTGVRTFSIKELDASTGNDIFFNITRIDGGFITGTKGLIEVCNEDNMTQKYSSTKDSITDGASSTAMGSTYYMHGNDKITVPGTYRVDGYANVDGTWKLVGRISGITATN